LIASTTLNVIPGPDAIYILTRSITQGKRAGLFSSFGICTGAFIHTVVAALGLSAILTKSAYAFCIIKYLGASYLIFLGIKSFFDRCNPFELSSDEDLHVDGWTVFIQGVLVDLLNPKVAVFFLSFLPQFVSSDTSNKTLTFIFLGAVLIGIGFLWDILLILASSKLVRIFKFKNNQSGSLINQIIGIIYSSLGVKLAIEKI
jgi:threonine/homoserine/homoserine lactone efflux protein